MNINDFGNEESANDKDLDRLSASYNSAEPDCKFNIGRELYKRYKATGNISAGIALLKELKYIRPTAKFINRELEINLDKMDLLSDRSYLTPSFALENKSAYGIKKIRKVLHVLNTSVPYLQNGYNIRSKYIVESQKKLRIQPVIITRPGYPNDFFAGLLKEDQDLIKHQIDGITYYRCLPQLFMRYTPLKTFLREYSAQINKVIAAESPDIIHAASNYVNGLAAMNAARAKKIPFFYEVRGFWELTTVSKEPLFKNSEEYKLAQMMESFLAHVADRVITISDGLKNELIRRGVAAEKILRVPNGVDCNFFKPRPLNKELGKKYHLDGKFVVGYIGSLTKYEGLQILLTVLAGLKKDGYKIKCLIVGNGDYRSTLEQLTKELNLMNDTVFVDHIPHEQVIEYYSLFDLCVYPRIDEEVTQMVTPLKPLEAMACGKPVIGAELDAMKEIVIHGLNGLIFNNSEADLYQKIKLLLKNAAFRNELRLNARQWVVKNRDWKKIAGIYRMIYQK